MRESDYKSLKKKKKYRNQISVQSLVSSRKMPDSFDERRKAALILSGHLRLEMLQSKFPKLCLTW